MATLTYTVQAIDGASGTFNKIALSAEDLSKQVDDLARKRADIKVALDDEEAQVALKDLDLKLTKLKTKTVDPDVTVKGLASAYAGIGRLDVALDRIGAKHVTATVDVKVNRKGLRGLLSGAAESGLSPGGAGGAGGLLGSPAGIGALVGGGAIAAGLVPSVVGLGIGGAAGLGTIAGGLFGAAEGKKELNADLANIKTITTALKTAIGQQKKDLSAALKDANKQYSKDAAFFQPFTNLQSSLQQLLRTVLIPLRTVMNPLAAIFTQFGKGLTSLGPQFAALFKASLPFIQQFLAFMLQAGKILLPAFTTAMNQMVKSGALQQMTQALVVLVQGLADFVIALGPGMAASAQIFARLITFISRALGPLGTAFSDIAKLLAADWSPGHLWNVMLASAKAFFSAVVSSAKAFGNAMSASFTTLRHDIATIWDALWNSTVARARTGVSAVVSGFRSFISLIGGVLSTLRSNIAGAWNTIWTNTKNVVTSGVSAVVGFFRGLPGKILSALTGLGHSLGSFASAAMNEMWSGFKNVAGSILNWLGGFAKSIISTITKILHMSPPHPGSAFFDLGVSMMQHLAAGIKASAHHAANSARSAAQGTAGAGHAGPGGGAPSANAALARRLMPAWASGAQWAAWNAVAMRESGWSNVANNASSGAYGIAQALPPSKYPLAGRPPYLGGSSNPTAQITWMIGYIQSRYGTPMGALAHENAYGWYDRGGWLPTGTSIAVNNTGQPEQVVGPASMSQVVTLLAQILSTLRVAPAATSAGTARALNSAARSALGAR